MIPFSFRFATILSLILSGVHLVLSAAVAYSTAPGVLARQVGGAVRQVGGAVRQVGVEDFNSKNGMNYFRNFEFLIFLCSHSTFII